MQYDLAKIEPPGRIFRDQQVPYLRGQSYIFVALYLGTCRWSRYRLCLPEDWKASTRVLLEL